MRDKPYGLDLPTLDIEIARKDGKTDHLLIGWSVLQDVIGVAGAIILLALGRTLFMPLIHLTSATDVHSWPFGLHVLIVLGWNGYSDFLAGG